MKRVRPSSRHRSREVALQTLYAVDMASARARREGVCEVVAPPTQEIFEGVAAHFEMPEGARVFAKQLVCEVSAHRAEIDELIGAHARNWRVSRMAAVDRNVLRLATYELSRTDIPPAVVLNEAVELARRFGSDASPAFVNGILDAIARSLREERP